MEASLVYRASSRTARVTQRISKNQKEEKEAEEAEKKEWLMIATQVKNTH